MQSKEPRLFPANIKLPTPTVQDIKKKLTASEGVTEYFTKNRLDLSAYITKIASKIRSACQHSAFNRDYIAFSIFHPALQKIELATYAEIKQMKRETGSLVFERETGTVYIRVVLENKLLEQLPLPNSFHEWWHVFLSCLRHPPVVDPECTLLHEFYSTTPFSISTSENFADFLTSYKMLTNVTEHAKQLIIDAKEQQTTGKTSKRLATYLKQTADNPLPPQTHNFPFRVPTKAEIDLIKAGHTLPQPYGNFPYMFISYKDIDLRDKQWVIKGELVVCNDKKENCTDKMHLITSFIERCLSYQKDNNFIFGVTPINFINPEPMMAAILECEASAHEVGKYFPNLFPQLYTQNRQETERWLGKCSNYTAIDYVLNHLQQQRSSIPQKIFFSKNLTSLLQEAMISYFIDLINLSSFKEIYNISPAWFVFAVAVFNLLIFREEVYSYCAKKFGYSITVNNFYNQCDRSIIYQIIEFAVRGALAAHNLTTGVFLLHDTARNVKRQVYSTENESNGKQTWNIAGAFVKGILITFILYTIGLLFMFFPLVKLPLQRFQQCGGRGVADGIKEGCKQSIVNLIHCIPGASALLLKQTEILPPQPSKRAAKKLARQQTTIEQISITPAPSVESIEPSVQTWASWWNSWKNRELPTLVFSSGQTLNS